MKKKSTEHSGAANNKVVAFFKKNIYFILMIVCILAIGAMITVAAVVNANRDEPDTPVINTPDPTPEDPTPGQPEDPNPGKPEDPKPFVFLMTSPFAQTSVDIGFDDTNLVHNPTQGHWATHLGVDLVADAGTQVLCGFDGKVSKVTKDPFWGTSVTIEHEGGFVSTYKLLADVTLETGAQVKQGDVLGVVSADGVAEIAQTPHIHLELTKDGKAVDVMQYLPEGDK